MEKSRIEVLGLDMAYVEVGEGDPIVFLHGNPTSSYLWRNVIPGVSDLGRCIAPDLIGMGDSGRLSRQRSRSISVRRPSIPSRRAARGARRRARGDVRGARLGVQPSASTGPGRHRDAVKGLAYMESIVSPVTWADWPERARSLFQAMRSDAGEEIILVKNVFIERILPASVMRALTEDEMAEYRRPYLEPGESRRPMLTWPREIPFEGRPADVHEIVASYAAWLGASDVPKLFINADPGSILTGRQREACRRWPNQAEVTVKGIHFVQEDSPREVAGAISGWYQSLG